MNNAQIFAVRLKNLRQLKNMSMAALSKALGGLVSPQAVYKYESGKMLPSSNVIVELSHLFEVPMDYFFKPIGVSLLGIEFRKKSKLGARECKAITINATDKLERYVEISDICGISFPEFKRDIRVVSSPADVLYVATELRHQYGVGNSRIPNVIQFLESIGVIVIEVDAPIAFDGFSGMAGSMPVIVINRGYQVERKRFTAMHELGHLIMNIDSHVTDKDKEKLCHLFAGEMLFDRESFKDMLGDISRRRISLQELADLQKMYGISIDAMMHKALDLGMINEAKYKNYNILKRTNPAFEAFVVESRYADERTDKYEGMVYRAYADNLISGSKASALLGIPVQEMMEHAMYV